MKDVAKVNRVVLLLHGELGFAAAEGLEVAVGLLEGLLDADVLLARRHAEVAKARAGLHLEVRRLGAGDIHGNSRPITARSFVHSSIHSSFIRSFVQSQLVQFVHSSNHSSFIRSFVQSQLVQFVVRSLDLLKKETRSTEIYTRAHTYNTRGRSVGRLVQTLVV